MVLAPVLVAGISPSPALASRATQARASTTRTRAKTDASSSLASRFARAVTDPTAPVPASNQSPPGRALSSNQVLEIARALPKMRSLRAANRGSFERAYLNNPGQWQVTVFSSKRAEIGIVIIADATGQVIEAWTGVQVRWPMARGHPSGFGGHLSALYIWLPLCLLFMLPFVDWRRPFSLLHLDLLVLLSFSVSLAFFNHAHIYASVPLTYPPLIYLLVRMLLLARPREVRRPALRLWIPARWLAVGVVLLLGFRIALNISDGNVIDVGYSGVLGAQRVVQDKSLYGNHYPFDNENADTYGPVNYEAYVPFLETFGWSGVWDDLPAAHAASILFDLLAVALMFLLGRRVRGPTLGVALAYAWVSYPFTLYALESNSNDALVGVLVLAAMLLVGSRPARGVLVALAGLAKFAPLALAPLFATQDLRRLPGSSRARALAAFSIAFVLTAAVVSVPALSHNSLATIYERTIEFQQNRGSPFSVWGLYAGLGGLQKVVQLAVVVFALGFAVVPRRADLVGLAAAVGAILIATQLGIEYWFYFYIPWFFGAVMLALLGSSASEAGEAWASESARSSLPVAA